MNFKDYSLEELIQKIKSGDTNSKEIFNYFLGRIEKYEDKIQAFNFVNKEGYEQSSASLAGIPLGIKDIFCEK